jgi:hypothetical protein
MILQGKHRPSEPSSERNLPRSERCPILITAAKTPFLA